MAFAMAGATAMIGASPAPAEGRSLRSSRTTSICRGVAEPRHAVAREPRVLDLALLEPDRLEEGTAQAHHRRAFDLVDQVVGVDDGAALEGRDDPDDLHAAGGAVDGDLGAGGDVAPLLGPARRCRSPAPARASTGPSRTARRRPGARPGAARFSGS